MIPFKPGSIIKDSEFTNLMTQLQELLGFEIPALFIYDRPSNGIEMLIGAADEEYIKWTLEAIKEYATHL